MHSYIPTMWAVFKKNFVNLTSFLLYTHLCEYSYDSVFFFIYKKNFVNNDNNKNLSILFIFQLVQIEESINEKYQSMQPK